MPISATLKPTQNPPAVRVFTFLDLIQVGVTQLGSKAVAPDEYVDDYPRVFEFYDGSATFENNRCYSIKQPGAVNASIRFTISDVIVVHPSDRFEIMSVDSFMRHYDLSR